MADETQEQRVNPLSTIRANFRQIRGQSVHATIQFPTPAHNQNDIMVGVCNVLHEDGWALVSTYPTHDGFVVFMFRDTRAHRPNLVLPPGIG